MREIFIHDKTNEISMMLTLEEDEYFEVWPFKSKEGARLIVERKKSQWGKSPFVIGKIDKGIITENK